MAYGMAGMPGNQRQVGLPRGMSGFPVVGGGLGGLPVRKSGVIKPYSLPSFLMTGAFLSGTADPYFESVEFSESEKTFYGGEGSQIRKYSGSGAAVWGAELRRNGSNTGCNLRGVSVYGDSVYITTKPEQNIVVIYRLDKLTGAFASVTKFSADFDVSTQGCIANKDGAFALYNHSGFFYTRILRVKPDGSRDYFSLNYPNKYANISLLYDLKKFLNGDLLVVGWARENGSPDYHHHLTRINTETMSVVWSIKVDSGGGNDSSYSKASISPDDTVAFLLYRSGLHYIYTLNGSDGSQIASKLLSPNLPGNYQHFSMAMDASSNVLLSFETIGYQTVLLNIKPDLTGINAQKISDVGTQGSLIPQSLNFYSGRILYAAQSYKDGSYVRTLLSTKSDFSEFGNIPAGYEQVSSWSNYTATLSVISSGPSASFTAGGATISGATAATDSESATYTAVALSTSNATVYPF